MNIPRLSVRNPVAVNLLMVIIVVTGIYSWMTLVREFFPNMEVEQVLITVPYPGATPEEIEKSVTRLIERELEDIDDVKRIESRVFEGLTLVTVELEENADRSRVLNEVRSELDKVKPDLPDGSEEPVITEVRPQIPVIALVVHGRATERVLHKAVLDVEEDLLDLPEVTSVVLSGMRDPEILIEIDPERLETFDLTFAEVGRVVAASNLDLPGGQLEGGRTNIRVRMLGEDQDPAAIEALIVKQRGDGSVVRLADVATVRAGFEDRVERGRFWEREVAETGGATAETLEEAADFRGASLTVFKTPEQDAIRIADAVKRYAESHGELAGGALHVTTTTNLARFIEQRLELMSRNALVGLILVLITLGVFLELRVAFWVAVGLPVAFLGTFTLMKLMGQTINLISLFGLIVVLGLIVDDAIVIGENIFTKLRSGVPPLQAAEEGASEVGIPVLAAVSTTIAAFVPLAFMQGRMGSFLGVLPAVVIAALSVSLVEAFVILPAHLAHKPSSPGSGRFRRLARRIGDAKHRIFEVTLPGILDGVLRFVLRWRYVAAAVAVATLMIAVGFVAGNIVPFVFLQDTDAETVTANVEMAAGTPESETLRTLAQLEMAAREEREVQSVLTVIGSMISDRGPEPAADPATVGQLVLELAPADQRQAQGLGTSQDMLVRLRRKTANLPGVRRLSWEGRSGGPGGADIEILVRGEDLEVVSKAVTYAEEKLATYEGVDEIYDDLERGKLEARLRLLPVGRLLGLTTGDLAQQVRGALFGFEAQDLQIGDEEVTVRVVLPPEARSSMSDLERFLLRVPSGRRVPLTEVAAITTERGYASLARVDGKRAATIRATVDETRGSVSDITTAMTAELADLSGRFPGVTAAFEGERKEMRESMGSLAIGFPAALLAIFVIIAVIFRSYAQPVIVMTIIPFSMVGAILGHWIMGYPFTLLSMIGVVALAGIVVNDGLILVDFANRERRSGLRATEAVVSAAKSRLRAILLTTITTVAGLAPLMLETSFQAQFLIPMAVSIVFGLAFATVLTLMLLPVFYLIFEDVRSIARFAWTGVYQRDLPYDPGHEGEPA